jgi:hypothetical protein
MMTTETLKDLRDREFLSGLHGDMPVEHSTCGWQFTGDNYRFTRLTWSYCSGFGDARVVARIAENWKNVPLTAFQ